MYRDKLSENAYHRRYYAKHKQRIDSYASKKRAMRRYSLKRIGATVDDYNQRYSEQQGRCAICGTGDTGRRQHFDYDHNHANGQLRGLLCEQCNKALGLFRDSPELLNSAAVYVRVWRNKQRVSVPAQII